MNLMGIDASGTSVTSVLATVDVSNQCDARHTMQSPSVSSQLIALSQVREIVRLLPTTMITILTSFLELTYTTYSPSFNGDFPGVGYLNADGWFAKVSDWICYCVTALQTPNQQCYSSRNVKA